MITKENRQALLKSQLSLFLGVLRTRVKGDGTDFKGICLKDVDGTSYILGVCGKDRPYGVSEVVTSDVGTDEPAEMDLLIRGVLTDEHRARGLSTLIAMNSGESARHLLEIFSERYLSVTILGEAVFSQAQKEAICAKVAPVIQEEVSRILDEAGVDRKALSIISQDAPSYKAYAFYAVKDERREARHQAAASYPALANVAAEIITVRQAIDEKKSLQAALMATSSINNHGEPVLSKAMLKKLAGRALQVKQSTLRALSEVPTDWFPKTDREMHYADGIIQHLSFLTGGDIRRLLAPSSGRFEDYAKTLALAYADSRYPDGATEADIDYLSKVINFKEIGKLSKKGNFTEVRRVADVIKESNCPLPTNITHDALHDYIIRTYAPDYSVREMKNTHDVAHHLLQIMEQRVTAPLIANITGRASVPVTHELMHGASEVAKAFLLQGKSPTTALEHFRKLGNQSGILLYGETKKYEIEELSEEKEEERIESLGGYVLSKEDRQLMREAMASTGRQEWATDFKPLRVNNVVIVPLLSTEDLTYEGEVMSNCLSDYYVGKSRNRVSSILSIRRITDEGVKNLATVEYTGGSGYAYRLNEVLGFGNSYAIPLDARNILTQFNTKIVEPLNQSIRGRVISETPQTKEEAKTGLDAIADYDWRKRRLVERASMPWMPYIARDFRKSVEDLAKMDVVRNAVVAIEPRARRTDDIIYA